MEGIQRISASENSWCKLIYQKIALEYYGLRIKNKKVQWN